MFRKIVAGLIGILLVACVMEEDLRIDSDGSGTYRVRITIPKAFGDLSEARAEAEKHGFTVEGEGETEQERFLALRKDFTDISALNDSDNTFELSMTDSGFLRRDYRLRASIAAIAFGGVKRQLIITMPGRVQSTSAGEASGSRVTWDGTNGGTIEISASGFVLPLSRNQTWSLIAAAVIGLLLLALRRTRRQRAEVHCTACKAPLASEARFCRSCGAASAPVAET